MYTKTLLPLMLFSSVFGYAGEEEAVAKKNTAAYVDAYNRRDVKGLSSLLSEDVDYIDVDSSEEVEGKKEMEELFQAKFKEQVNGKIEAKIDKVTAPEANVIEETGVFTLISPQGESSKSAFRITLEKQNGEWVIGELREARIASTPEQYEHLKPLEWLIGQWVDEDEDVEIASTFAWDLRKNFILQNFIVTTEGTVEQEGKQIIGWDAEKEEIRSWMFDSDGSFGEATWIPRGNGWDVEMVQTLSDGSRASATYNYTPKDKDSYIWSATGREVDGAQLPDIDPVTVTRKKG